MNVKRSAWVFFAVFWFCLGILMGCDKRSRSDNSTKSSIEAHPLFTPEAATLAQQKICDEQAAKRFLEDKNSDDFGLKKRNPPITSYTSHYDPAVNVCYVRINSFSAKPAMVTAVVYDAFGGRVYATYTWLNSEGEKFYEVPPTECDIDIPGKPDELCKTAEEFDELTEKYFGVTK